MISDADIDRAIREACGGDPWDDEANKKYDRAIYRAGFAAGQAEAERLRALLREARTVVLPAWVGASPKPTHLAITPERQSLADRIDAALAEGKE